ncbi:MAG: hypothetical protein L7V86_19430 [Verrucomicrobiales bacterium]|nr:hypothetical protein [Verrucomicrobiales bacterium]
MEQALSEMSVGEHYRQSTKNEVILSRNRSGIIKPSRRVIPAPSVSDQVDFIFGGLGRYTIIFASTTKAPETNKVGVKIGTREASNSKQRCRRPRKE